MKQRLEQFLQSENISKAQFADSINVARAAVSHIMAGRNNPSYEFILSTMKTYPELNIEWLLSGKGFMYKNAAESTAPAEGDDSSLFGTQFSQSPEQLATNVEPKESKSQFPAMPSSRKISGGKRIIILYEDGTYEEFC